MPRDGMGSHQSSAMINDEWLTPPEILASLGDFDLDPCACSVPRPGPTETEHFTRSDNGLMKRWCGRVWLNPPYGGPSVVGPWMRRMADHNVGTALIFARTETEVFHDTVWTKASAVLFLRGRLFFHYRDGRRASANAGAPSAICAYGNRDADILRACGLPGQIVDLR